MIARRRVVGVVVGPRDPGAQRHREADLAVAGPERGAEDGDDRARLRVEDRSPGGTTAQPQRVTARRADRQLQGPVEEVEAVRRRVRHGRRAQHPCLAPAAGRQPDVAAGLDAVADGHRQRDRAEALGAHQGQVEFREGGDRVGGHDAAAVAGGVQHEPGQAVDGLMARDDRAVVVGDESGAARPTREVADPDEGGIAVGGGEIGGELRAPGVRSVRGVRRGQGIQRAPGIPRAGPARARRGVAPRGAVPRCPRASSRHRRTSRRARVPWVRR
ncbi:hypothetical protein B6E66_32785 [Streptomyces maremycinicus]|nr:hypothetical protein B6E66_32785 [Streptomyces sp. B9173]